jgi:nucleoside-diphosphate-sugar epimerase
MKLLITGASSILARRLVTVLLERGRFSFRLLQHHAEVKIKSCETVFGDMNDPESLEGACQGMDGVLHLAALTHSCRDAEYFRVNREGTRNLINACKRNNVGRFIFISSAAASAEAGAYGVSKLESEELVGDSGLEWIILRPSEVYGPQMKERIGALISWVRNLKIIPVIGDGSYCMSPVYVDDVVDAIAQVVMKPDLINQRLNLCGPEIISFDAIIDRLSQYMEVRRHKIYMPICLARLGVSLASFLKLGSFTPDQIPRILCKKDQDIGRTSTLISYFPRKFESGLREYL